jgi:hypothetical protein
MGMDSSLLLIFEGVTSIVVAGSIMYGLWNYIELRSRRQERVIRKHHNKQAVIRSRPKQKIAEYIRYGLRLKSFNYGPAELRRRSWDDVDLVHPPEALPPLSGVNGQDLLWGRVYREPGHGVRYDLRPMAGGPVTATLEWHQANLSDQAIAQVGDQLVALYARGGTNFAVDVNSGMTVAAMNRLAKRVTIGSRVYQWYQEPSAAFFSPTNGEKKNGSGMVVKFDWSHRRALDDPSYLLYVHPNAPEEVIPVLTLLGLYQLAGQHV